MIGIILTEFYLFDIQVFILIMSNLMCILNIKFSKWEADLHQLYVKTTQIINRSGCIFIFNIDRGKTSSN